jgi:hypothetical protein
MAQTTKYRNSAMYTYNPSYTFPGSLPEEIFRRPTIGTPALDEFAQLRQGIRTNQYLILQPEIDKVLQLTSGCSPTYANAGTFSDRKITVAEFDVAQQWCKTDWEAVASVLTNDPTWMANGQDGFQLTQKLDSALTDALLDAVRRDLWRILLFGNTTASNSNYNMIEGIIGKMFDGLASYCVGEAQNDPNGNFPTNPNAVLVADQGYYALQATHQSAPIALKQIDPSEKVFWVTGKVYESLLRSYESKTNGATELQFRYIVEGPNIGAGMGVGVGDGAGKSAVGTAPLTYRGIPVVPLYIADNYLTDTTNPWYNVISNFIIYTTRGRSKYANHVVGTENAADLNRLDTWYDGRLRTVYKQGNMRLGYNFINCNLTCFHY